jgi:glycosyltransferase involved in cell wall biosynthesis
MSHAARVYNDTGTGANILCVDQFVHFGGGQLSLFELLPALSERGWSPAVALPGDGSFPQAVRHLGFETHTFVCADYACRKKPLWQMFKYALQIPKLVESLASVVEQSKVDLLYVNGPRLVPPTAWVAWRKGIPMVFHCHTRPLQSSAVALTGQALELASAHMIACCQYVAEPFREYVERQRLRVLYNGVRDMAVSQQAERKIRKVALIGRVEVEKGQLEFVRAAKIVLQSYPDCRFLIVGAPMFSSHRYYLKVFAFSRGLPIEFVPWVKDIAEIYPDLDLLVVPSNKAEATPRVIPEAFSARVPVVAFPSGGIPEILKDDKTGFVAANMSVEALAQRIISVLRMDRSKLAEVIETARNEWQRRFTLHAYRQSVCNLLAAAMDRSNSGHLEVGKPAPVLSE